MTGFQSKSKAIADALFETNYQTKLASENWLNLGGKEYRLIGKMVRIGRALDNDIVVDDRSCSRYHAVLSIKADQVTLEDLKSRNGVKVNSKLIRSQRLEDNDEVEIGDLKGIFFQKQRTGTRHEKQFAKENTVSRAVEGLKEIVVDRKNILSKFKELPKALKLGLFALIPILGFILLSLMGAPSGSAPLTADSRGVSAEELDPSMIQRDAFVEPAAIESCLELEDLGNYRKAKRCFRGLAMSQDVFLALKRIIETQQKLTQKRFQEGERAFENYFYDLAIVKYQEVLLIADDESEVFKKAADKIRIAEQKKRLL